jgi:hypothetical protein
MNRSNQWGVSGAITMRTDTVDESQRLSARQLQERALDGQRLLTVEERTNRNGERFYRYVFKRIAQAKLPPLTYDCLIPQGDRRGSTRM